MGKLSNSVLATMETELNPDPITLLKMDYAIQVIKNEGIKLIILSVFYALIGQALLFFFAAGLLIPVRIFSGGLHMKTNITCFLFSFSFFALAVLLLPRLQLTELSYNILLLISVAAICLCSPVATSRKPIVSRRKYLLCKAFAVISAIIVGLLLLLLPDASLRYVGIWTLSLQALQLAAAFSMKTMDKRKEHTYEKL